MEEYTETNRKSDGGSFPSEVEESPKSVGNGNVGEWRTIMKKMGYVHSQVLRIREEDSHIGEDIGEGLSAKDKVLNEGFGRNRLQVRRLVAAASVVDVMLLSRPILPCSPLRGNAAATIVKPLH